MMMREEPFCVASLDPTVISVPAPKDKVVCSIMIIEIKPLNSTLLGTKYWAGTQSLGTGQLSKGLVQGRYVKGRYKAGK